jgi:hypothetical protein
MSVEDAAEGDASGDPALMDAAASELQADPGLALAIRAPAAVPTVSAAVAPLIP